LSDPLGPRGGRPILPAPDEPAATLEDQAETGEPRLVVTADRNALADAAAVRLVHRLATAVEMRGRADVALTGGSTAGGLYRRLVQPDLRDRVDWSRVHLWWGDDRFVPRADPLSNVRAADETLFAPGGIPIPGANVHPFPSDRAIAERLGPGWCAATYAAAVVDALPPLGGWPAFDVVLVGIGADGHLLSVFPGSPALGSDRVGLAIPAPTHIEPHVKRVTLNPAILGAAGQVLALAAGPAKAAVIARILVGPRDPFAFPATLARRTNATWLVDADAATVLL
jgi:6-phosphogluconolactonase